MSDVGLNLARADGSSNVEDLGDFDGIDWAGIRTGATSGMGSRVALDPSECLAISIVERWRNSGRKSAVAFAIGLVVVFRDCSNWHPYPI